MTAFVRTGILLVAVLAALPAWGKATWTTIASGPFRGGFDSNQTANLKVDGAGGYRLQTVFKGGLVQFGPGVTYMRPQRHTYALTPVQAGNGQTVWLSRINANADFVWMLSFGKDQSPRLRMLVPTAGRQDSTQVTGARARKILATPAIDQRKGSYKSTWSLHALDGELFHALDFGDGSPARVIGFREKAAPRLEPVR